MIVPDSISKKTDKGLRMYIFDGIVKNTSFSYGASLLIFALVYMWLNQATPYKSCYDCLSKEPTIDINITEECVIGLKGFPSIL